MNQSEKAEMGAKTFQGFCEQFGGTFHARILLEELFEGLINAETLFIFGEPEQGWDQISDGTTGNGDDERRPDQLGETQPATGLGETDRPNYP